MRFTRRAGSLFVPRTVISAPDWTHATLSQDGEYHSLDLSSVVPSNTKQVFFNAYLTADGVGASINLRPTGLSGYLQLTATVLVANEYTQIFGIVTIVGSGTTIEYRIRINGHTISDLGLVIVGHYI